MSDKTDIRITDTDLGQYLHENEKIEDLELVNPHAPEKMEWRGDLKTKLRALWVQHTSRRNWPNHGFSLVPQGFEVWERSGPPLGGECRRFKVENGDDGYWMVEHQEPWWYEDPARDSA